ncbi:MAG: hypothetical protein GF308_09860 [Candidatus Heimdallarchaeota archaeon]|nr:hypothetical protein [Candidatus Heimdallarchaeota archaeon]
MEIENPGSDEELQMKKILKRQKVEAALYLAGRPVPLTELVQVTDLETSEITSAIRDLQEKYRQFFSCFEIRELPGRKFVFQVKSEITHEIKEIALQPILSLAELRTLAMIAYQQPILQSKVAKVRGQQAYGHIKTLIRKGFIKSKPHRQTLELRTTQMFSDYFGLSYDQGVLKRQLGWRTKRVLKKQKKTKEKDNEKEAIDRLLSKLQLEEDKELEEDRDNE